MALNLTVPALEDKPLINAETRPPKILEFLAKLPSNSLDAASVLQEEMEILNRQKVSPDHRFKALEIYRSHAADTVKHLAPSYCSATLPLQKNATAYAAAAKSLWLELAYGYKLTLTDQVNQLFNPNSKITALIIYRAMHALHELSMVYYQTYFNLPGNIWSDLHQLYYYSVQQSLHEISLQQQGEEASINLLYKQILLMSIADPQHLAVQDIELVADYIARFASHGQLQDLGQPENPAGIFVISLDDDKPPIPYIKTTRQTDGASNILFITVELARLVHQHLQIVQSGNIPRNSGLPETASDARFQDILVYLLQHWGVSPKRIYKRSSKNNVSQLGIGLIAAHFFLNNEQFYAQPSSAQLQGLVSFNSAQTNASRSPIKYSNWQVLNISAGGTALRKFPTVSAEVNIGDLLSIKNENEKTWAIAVLRWANHGEQGQLDIGAQLIAPSAKACGVHLTNADWFELALMLPAMPAIKQATSIIMSAGFYAHGRLLELDVQGTISRIMITKLVERTRSFERFQFSIL
jgi:cyclic-di-GMP-binding protein